MIKKRNNKRHEECSSCNDCKMGDVGTHVFRKIGWGGRRHSSKNPLMKQEQKENYVNHSKRNGETIIQRTAPVGCDAVM
jgi:hypothetical protein